MKKLIRAVVGLLTLTLSASAIAIPTLTLTELGNTLSWSWDNGLGSGTVPLQFSSPYQYWEGAVPMGPLTTTFTGSWLKPGDPTKYNNVIFYDILSGYSEVANPLPGKVGVPDGTPITSSDGTINVIYRDLNGAPASVPDVGSTLLLLSCAVGSLGILARRGHFRRLAYGCGRS